MGDKTALLAVIETERQLHPRMGGPDLQKLIYQSVFGGDHLLVDPVRFAAGVREEWAWLADGAPAAAGPALQSIDPEGRTARIHLAVCARRGIDVERLIDFLSGQDKKDGRRADYVRRWRETIELAAAGSIPFDAEELERVGFPEAAPHHSPGYGPASYRIVHDVTDPRSVADLDRLEVR
jgi:hypothetical protein